jgi:hypothetical protein
MKKKKVEKKEYKNCLSCKRDKITTSFYSSNSPMFDGRVSICKTCLLNMIDEDDLNSVKNILRQIDKPFISDLWDTCIASNNDTFGTYMKNVNSLQQYRNMTYANSAEAKGRSPKSKDKNTDKSIDDIEELETEDGSIKISQEIKAKFGGGYTNLEYLDMEKFYQDMMATHEINSPQHRKLLVNLCKLNVKIDRCLEDEDYGSFEKINKQHEAMLKSAGWRPADRVAGNEAQGIRTFSQIFEEIEKDGFITPAPIEVHQDIVDLTIMYMLNYTRRLVNTEVMHEPPKDTPKVGQ